jgi:hypothetical protein
MDSLINEYYDKCFISSLLCELSYGFYSFLYQCIIFPTILSSSILTVLNSSEIDKDTIKIINIIVNGLNTILLAINSNFKLNDRYNSFRSMKIKFNALLHRIESDKNKKLNDHSYIINVDDIINSFDSLYNDLSYQFPTHIKNKVINKYGNKKKLPNSLQIDVECSTPSATATVNVVSFN